MYIPLIVLFLLKHSVNLLVDFIERRDGEEVLPIIYAIPCLILLLCFL